MDYCGVSNHLKGALAVYSDDDAEGALYSFKYEIPKLRDQPQRAVDVLFNQEILTINGQVESTKVIFTCFEAGTNLSAANLGHYRDALERNSEGAPA